ncbi:MAG: endonuclease/exonuclease/phosphatase family protein [Actinomycetota bacterium]|nr:endonuclease/exonuclease/phosphatase family protein [Actinomycetota bacterium]
MSASARTLSRRQTAVLLVAVLATAAVILPAFTRPAHAACKRTPNGRVLVMSNNVYEVDKQDARKTGDMRRFVTRMKEMAPGDYAPDIVLIQEARRSAVGKIKKFMENKWGCTDFAVPVNASKTGWTWINKYSKLGGKDTAVIINRKTVRVNKKGYISHGYSQSESASGEPVKVKKTAWVDVTEKSTQRGGDAPLRHILAGSVHFPRGSDFRSQTINLRLKKEFAVAIAKKFDAVQSNDNAPGQVIHVIGGDFNNYRYTIGDPTDLTPMYAALTQPPFKYIDGPIEFTTGGIPNPIDFLFSTGTPLRAGSDDNNTHNEGSPNFYSNHDLRWSLLTGGQ